MNLVIDIGNSRAKLAVFKNNEILKTQVCLKGKLNAQQQLLRREFPEIKDGILANVAKPEKSFKGAFQGLKGKKIELSADTPVPFDNQYHSPGTLGLDRIALAAAAVCNNPGEDVFVIDAGTCVTYDIVTCKKDYLGGAISPGLSMRYRALNNFTANLPNLRGDNEDIPPIGRNTTESLRLGVRQGLVYEIDGFINQFQARYDNLTVILTGGDSEILSKSLKNSIFVTGNFLLTGLNCILEFNKH